MPQRRKPPPFDPAIVHNHPGALRLPSAAFGSLMRLVIWWLCADCPELPESSAELAHICRAHRSTWSGNKADVLSVFADIRSEFEADRAKRLRVRASLARISHGGVSAIRERALRRKLVKPEAPAAVESISQLTPIGKARLDRAPETKPGAGGFVDR